MRQSKILLFTFLISALSVAATANDKAKDPNKGMVWVSGDGGTRASASGGQNEIKTDDTAGNSQAAAGKPKPKPKPSGSGKSLPMEEISMNYTKVQRVPKQQPDNIASPQKPKQGMLLPAVQAAREAAKSNSQK
ncbi:MAG TPA: hypothetical protein VJS66_09140 [Burkholderiales bacterium]|nr:hypothetical protein [Burkholderiales bacterium]